MKQIFTKSIILFVFMWFSTYSFAQDTINVDQGLGTLNAAIDEHGGDVVYKLKAGSWYGLNAIIEASDSTLGAGGSLTIIGEETDEMPAIIQVGNSLDGGVLPLLIRTFNDLTLKNLFFSDQDATGTVGSSIIDIAAPAKIVMDNCVIDPAGQWYMIDGADPADGSKLFLTNNLFLRNGNMAGPNDPGYMGSNQWDTLYIENNTFVSSGQSLFVGARNRIPPNNFIWVNHNSFFWHDVWLGIPFNDLNYYMTNNLFHDVSIFSQLQAWVQFFPDPETNKLLSLMNTDTLEYADGTLETLPSQRIKFWQRNLQYNSTGVKSMVDFAKKDSTVSPVFAIPMLWDTDVPEDFISYTPEDSVRALSREYKIFNDDVSWPYMKYNNNFYDLDPQYNEAEIYKNSDRAGENALDWFKKYIWALPDIPEPIDWPSYNWDVDGWAGNDPAYYPEVWPRFDGTYTNPTLLTASTEELPLGDLNWFPDAKAKWAANKDAVTQHILSLSEDQYHIVEVGVEQTLNNKVFSVYPNPVQDVLSIKSIEKIKNVKIYSITGALHNVIDMKSHVGNDIDVSYLTTGIYILKVNFVKGGTFSAKITKE